MRRIESFPQTDDFSEIPADLIVATQGATLTSEPHNLRLYPASAGGYVGLQNIYFDTPQKVIWVGEEIAFTETLLNNIDRSFKHIIINRLTETVRNGSGDRGITYVWHDGSQNFTLGACNVTECTYEGGGIRPVIPIPENMFSLRRYQGQPLYVVSEFNLHDHAVRVYVSTKDGAYRNYLLASRSLNSVESELDYWNRIDIIGAYVDRGVIADPSAYMQIGAVTFHNAPLTAPETFFGSSMNRVYLSRRLGSGTEADPYYSELARYVYQNFGVTFHRQVIGAHSPLVVSVYDTTDAQDTQITTNVNQVISINVPALDNTWGSLTAARRNTITNRLTGLGFNVSWIVSATTIREIVEFLAESLQLAERLSIKLGVNRSAPDFQSIGRTVGDLTAAERTALQNVLADERQSTTLNNSDSLRTVCGRLRQKFITPVINDLAQVARGVNR